MDLNSLYHGALKVAELTNFPKERVSLVQSPCITGGNNFHKAGLVGVEFCGAGLFVVLDEDNFIEVIVEMGSEAYLQPLDRMCGKYVNPRMALAAAGMIIAGCDLMCGLDNTLSATVHMGVIPDRHTVVTVVNNSFGQE